LRPSSGRRNWVFCNPSRAPSAVIQTECTHGGQPIRIEINSDLNVLSVEEGADPPVFMPLVDFSKLEEPSIIDAL
jgi:hypothetical protein